MADPNDSNPSSPTSKGAKAKAIKGPPRPPNAWILYRSDKLKELEQKAPAGKPRRPQAAISKEISVLWKAESKEVKARYEYLSDLKKAEHQAKYPGYRFQPVKKEEKERLKLEAKKQKAKDREEAGGAKRNKRRSSGGSTSKIRKSSTPPLDEHLLPPNFSFTTPLDSMSGTMHVFDSSAPVASTSNAFPAFPTLHAPIPGQPIIDISNYSLDNLGLGLDFGPTFNSEDGSYAGLDQSFLELSFPGGSLGPLQASQDGEPPVPLGWNGDQDGLGATAHEHTLSLLSGQIIGGENGVYYLKGFSAEDLAANPSGEIQLSVGQGLDTSDFMASDFDFSALLSTPLDFGSLSADALSPYSAPTPSQVAGPSSLPTPVDHVSPAELSQAPTPTESEPATPVTLPMPRAVYGPPAGAQFNSGRRVAATWARA